MKLLSRKKSDAPLAELRNHAVEEFSEIAGKKETRQRLVWQCPCCSRVDGQQSSSWNHEMLAECDYCKTVYDIANLQEPAELYSESYFFAEKDSAIGYGNYADDRSANIKNFQTRFAEIEKILPSRGAFLDVGCALGHALDVAAERGWKIVIGIDSSEFCVREVQKRKHFATRLSLAQLLENESIHGTVIGPNFFDFIMMNDVIEHFAEPQKHLEAAFRLLKPGGVLFVHTPNATSIMARILRSRWFHIKPEEHLVYFSKCGLSQALSAAGFIDIRVGFAVSWLTLPSVGLRLQRWGLNWSGLFKFLLQIEIFSKMFFPVVTGNMRAVSKKPNS